jgi:hypothetical protein
VSTRTGSVIIGIAATAALVTTLALVLRLSGAGLRGLADTLLRVVRSETDHPHWELLAQ